MDKAALKEIAQKLVVSEKGILAADESFPTIKKRLEKVGVDSTEENRRAYRELLLTTPGIEKFISGVIMFDETTHQVTKNDVPFVKLLAERGMIPGIKVDKRRVPFGEKGEEVSEGLAGLSGRLKEYRQLGLRFTKWRAVVVIGDGLPTKEAISENAKRMAEYAKVSQEEGFVPIVEPEVLRDGAHNIARNEEATRMALSSVFSALEKENALLSGMLLKPNMITAGKDNPKKANPREVARATLRVLSKTVPEEVPGIVFLSGGQSPKEATANLNAINSAGRYPWKLSFSFGRALQNPALEIWRGQDKNVKMAQEAFYQQAQFASLARQGKL